AIELDEVAEVVRAAQFQAKHVAVEGQGAIAVRDIDECHRCAGNPVDHTDLLAWNDCYCRTSLLQRRRSVAAARENPRMSPIFVPTARSRGAARAHRR